MADIFGTISTIDSGDYNISRYISKFIDMLIEFVVCSFTSKKVLFCQELDTYLKYSHNYLFIFLNICTLIYIMGFLIFFILELIVSLFLKSCSYLIIMATFAIDFILRTLLETENFFYLLLVSSNVSVPVTMFRALDFSPTGRFILLTHQVQSYLGVVALSVSIS